ncbi:MAG: hypothetical protein QW230_05000, partial [Thermofilum sp.]
SDRCAGCPLGSLNADELVELLPPERGCSKPPNSLRSPSPIVVVRVSRSVTSPTTISVPLELKGTGGSTNA